MTASAPAPFRELHFGHLDASQEAAEEPDLLLDGFYDYREAAYGVESQKVWLLLGPKGSGKSAVIEHLRLRWHDRYDRFFTVWPLGGFPVNDVTQIKTGQSVGGSRAQSAWEFLLLLRVIESLAQDEGLEAPASFWAMVKALQQGGFIVGDWLAKVSKWSSTTIKFDAKIIGAEGNFDSSSITPLEVSSYLRKQISSASSSNRHVVALDGLDTFFFEAEDEWTSLAGLMQAMHALNREFAAASLPVSLIAAVRSDIFDMLPGPEMNKLKPHAVHLDWHAFGIGADNHLWKLLTKKAAVGKPNVTNLVTQYLGTHVQIGPHSDLTTFLLEQTRLLPRDAVALMSYLQREYGGSRSIPEDNAKRAVRLYAEEYFVGEIFDNLAGVLSTGKARGLAAFKDALRTAPSRYFDFDFVCAELKGELEDVEVKLLLRQMFETGGIGVRNGAYTDFVFRKVSGAGFTTRYKFMLHDALTRAWNRPWH